MKLTKPFSRRRFIAISAAACAFVGSSAADASPWRWQGVALGAKASLLLHHPDQTEANRIILACVTEIERLENIFSLYRKQTALVQLNRDGFLDHPPFELIQALSSSRNISDITGGAFDVSVQPLWQLYAQHFAAKNADPAGPAAADIQAARHLVDYQAIDISNRRISFARPGMAVTLNGFAQGFITDRIADLLRGEGLHNVLIDMGETRALDGHPGGRPWRVGLRDPKSADGVVRTLALENSAMATSGGYGQSFLKDSPYHHLFDPATGHSSQRYASVTVTAPLAATADALATGLSSLAMNAAAPCLRKAGAKAAYYLQRDGSLKDIRI